MKTIPVIYVAGAYRAPTREGVELNIQAARSVGLLCCRKGWSPIIPHSNTGHLDAIDPRIGDEFWLASTLELMRRCDAVVLVSGWAHSAGTRAEIEEAMRLGIPVFWSESNLFDAQSFLAGGLAENENDNTQVIASLKAV